MIILLALAGLLAIPVGRFAVGARARAVRARALAPVRLENVEYRLLGVTVTERIPQRGGPAVSASGVFAIVKLSLRSVDRRAHVISTDNLALDASGTYYAASSPDDIGLSDRQWGAATAATTVAPGRSLTVKVLFDVPRRTFQRPVALYVGQFGLAAQAPPRVLYLSNPPACCATSSRAPSRQGETIPRLVPYPVLGSISTS